MIARRKFRTKEARKRERIRLAVKAFIITIIVIVVFILVSYASHYEKLRINTIYVQTDGVLGIEEITSVIENSLEKDVLWIWPKDSSFLLSHRDIEQKLIEQFPRVESVEIKRPGFYSLSANVVERAPEALWCGDMVPPVAYRETRYDTENNKDIWGACFLLDEKGYIYARAPIFSGNIFPRYYGSLERAEPIAQQYLPQERFELWQNFYKAIQYDDIEAQALLFVDERDIELYLTNGVKVLVPREENMDLIEVRLLAVLESGEIDTSKEIEYVDLRFGKKAFVKYYGEKLDTE